MTKISRLGLLRTSLLPSFYWVCIFLQITLLIAALSPTTYALTDEDRKRLITPFYDSTVSGESSSCAFGSAPNNSNGGVSITAFNPDPQARDIYQNTLRPIIQELAPLYQQAAQAEGLADWELLPALHNLEFGLQRTNPTTNVAFKGVFQLSGDSLRRVGVDTNSPTWEPGRGLSDEQFVEQAQAAIGVFIKGKGQSLGIDIAQPLNADQVARIAAAYKSGEGSAWFRGGADINLHAYAWAGYDTSPEHVLPMAYGPGSPYADEQTNDRISKPGAATLFMLLKNDSLGNGSSTCPTPNGLTPITGSREELVERALNNPDLRLGNLGGSGARTQRSDIESVISEGLLKLLVAILEQTDSPILVNAIKSDHRAGTLHGAGRAIDIGYYGNGHAQHNEQGDALYKFVYTNAEAFNIAELIWQEPPTGYSCADATGPVDCYVRFGKGVMDQHYHHIHIGVGL